MTNIPELNMKRGVAAMWLNWCNHYGTKQQVVACAGRLLEIDEELRIRSLPAISPYDRRFLHMGGDPAQVYHGKDLELYYEIKERETETK